MKNKFKKSSLLVCVSLLAISACSTHNTNSKAWTMPDASMTAFKGEDPRYPARPNSVYQQSSVGDLKVPSSLHAWLSLALAHNPSIKIAQSRYSEALANKANVDSGLRPTLNASISTTRTRTGNEDSLSPATTRQSSRGALDLRIPIDLSGRLSAGKDAVSYLLVQRKYEVKDAKLTALQNVVLSSIDAAEQSLLQELNKVQLSTNHTSLKLTELRYTKGQAQIVDVLQQKDLVASLQQETPTLNLRRQTALDGLSQLVGKLPGSADDGAFRSIPDLAASDRLISPLGLLNARPDLQALKAGLDAADSRVSAAIRDRLPTIDFSSSAVASLVSGDISSVVSGTLSAAMTLFDGGAKRATVRARRAELERFGAVYIEAWLRAVVEVDGLLAEEIRRTKEYELVLARLDNARKLHSAAERRYRLGASDYLPVLSAKRTIEQQERSLISTKASLMRARVQLHIAMGGDISVPTQEYSESAS